MLRRMKFHKMNEQIASSFWDCRRPNANKLRTSLSAGSLDMIGLAFGRAMPSLRISESKVRRSPNTGQGGCLPMETPWFSGYSGALPIVT